jgi:Zn-dependent peptidase ImmA (M78 family)
MPENSLRKKLSEIGGRVSEAAIELLAEHFKVSKAAMEIRLNTVTNLIAS